MDETVTFRIEAPFPQAASLADSVRFWDEKLRLIKSQGWKIYAWKEFEGMKRIAVEEGGKPITPQRIFYAMAYCTNAEKITCEVVGESELGPEKKPLAKEWQ